MYNRTIGLLVCGLIFTLIAGSAVATDYHYYSLGQQIDVETSDSLVTVVLNPDGEGALRTVDAPCIDTTFEPINVNGSTWSYGILDSWTIDSALINLRNHAAVKIANPVLATPDSTPVYLTDEFTVRVVDEASIAEFEAFVQMHNVEIREIDSVDDRRYMLRMTAESAEDLLEISNAFYESDLVEYSAPNFYNVAVQDHVPNDTYYSFQWHLKNNTFPGADIHFEEAIDFNWDERETVTVAIIDAGFDLSHEDFDSTLLYHWYDAAGDNLDSLPPDFDPSPGYGDHWKDNVTWAHGTNVLGIVNAVTDNELGVAGIAPFCRFILIKAWDNYRRNSVETLNRGMQWVAIHGWMAQCQIMVAPWHMLYPSDDIERGMFLNWEHNIVSFFPSGSDAGSVNYPGLSKYAISVGATNIADVREFFSATGDSLDVVAPGVDIFTIDRMDELGAVPIPFSCYRDSSYHCKFTGTSASCAIAAGIAARVLARAPEAKGGTWDQPGAYGRTFDYIRTVLTGSADDLVGGDNTPCWDAEYGYGRVNAHKAIIAVAGGDPNNSGATDIDDVVYLIAYIFTGGPAP
ncbi:MAG: S8 family serine peptidase, partial [candidate division Zixibacteria bacterium]|nr:S8 family serine peptidase [candidate division Zixibacteria bacterium]